MSHDEFNLNINDKIDFSEEVELIVPHDLESLREFMLKFIEAFDIRFYMTERQQKIMGKYCKKKLSDIQEKS